MKVSQRDVVELYFSVGNSEYKYHPAIVLSNEDVLLTEDFFLAAMISHSTLNEEFSFEIKPYMLTQALKGETSFVKCQLIERFYSEDVTGKFGSMKPDAFEKLMKALNLSVFFINCNP